MADYDTLERSGEGFARTYALDNIEILRSGDGRTVEAYAAMFGEPYEVMDQHGHYREVIHRSAFDKHLSTGAMPICIYNHGYSLTGQPDAMASVPLGTPLEVRPDGRGLVTITRYNKTDLASAVLEAIRAGDIRSQSFRGRVIRSTPDRVPRSSGGSLPTVTRMELGLTDYGPTPIPVNDGARILAVRSSATAEATRAYDPWWDHEKPPKSMAELRRRVHIWQHANGVEHYHPRRPNW